MKATFLLDNLLGKLSFLNQAVSVRAQLPILSGFLLEAEKGKLKITATDLEIGISVSIPASVEEEGKIVVPAKPFSELMTTLQEEKITIERKEKTISVFGKKTKANLLSLDEVEFPNILEDKGEKAATIKKDSVVGDFSKVAFAAALDTGRPAFSGILLKGEKEGVLIVATDSHRLSKKISSGARSTRPFNKPILVPSRTIKALLINKSDEDVDMYVSEKNNQIIFYQGDTVLVGRLIDAEYPEFEKIIPTDSSTRTEFDRQEMQNALKTAEIFARDNANIIRISIRKSYVSVFGKSSSLGENEIQVQAKTTGEENEIAFNGRYLLDLLQNIEEETMVFEMTGPLNPGVFKIAGDNSFIHLIMPIRVKDEELN